MKINLLKCKDCGGVVLRQDALRFECLFCGKSYGEEYFASYEEKTGFMEKNYDQVKQMISSMEISNLANFLRLNLTLSKTVLDDNDETLFYRQYEIENCIITALADISKRHLEIFEKYPRDTNATNTVINIISTCRDVIHAVSEKIEHKISYNFTMTWFSNFVRGYINKAFNYGYDRWNRYSHEEDLHGWTEFIEIMSNCIEILDAFRKYEVIKSPGLYNDLIYFEEKCLNLTYVHRYWIGNYHASQNVGLSDSAKLIRMEHLKSYRTDKEKLENEQETYKEKRKNEERMRIEAEKKARNEKYWAENEEEKERLLNEREELMAEIRDLEIKKVSLDTNKELEDLREEKKLVQSSLDSLGLFAGKEKKAKKAQLEQLDIQCNTICSQIRDEKAKIQTRIDAIKQKIAFIESEFSRDR